MELIAVHNTAGKSPNDIMRAMQNGGKLVIYPYCESFLFWTTRKYSEPLFLESNSTLQKVVARKFIYKSLLRGLWSFPFGPLTTIKCTRQNLKGGIDVTVYLWSKLYLKMKEQGADEPLKDNILISPLNLDLIESK